MDMIKHLDYIRIILFIMTKHTKYILKLFYECGFSHITEFSVI